MKKEKLFLYDKTKGNIDFYKINPKFDIYVDAINIENGEIKKKKIVGYTIHRNLRLFKVIDSLNRFKPFWVSDDHSVIVFDIHKMRYKKETPINIIKNPSNYFLIKTILGKKEFIRCDEISIIEDTDKTIAADFTVEDFFTFSTADGVFVQDTMAINVPLSKEAIQEIKEKLILPSQGQKIDSDHLNLGQGMNVGIWVLTKDPDKNIPLFKIEAIPNESRKNYETFFVYIIKHQNKKFNRGVVLSPGKVTTLGRMLFRMFFPADFQNYIEEKQYKKGDLVKIFNLLVDKYGYEQAGNIVGELTKFLFKIYSYIGYSITLDIISLKDKFKEMKEKLSTISSIEEQQKLIDKMNKELKEEIKKNYPDFYDLVESGAAKGWSQIFSMLTVKGHVKGLTGDIDLVDHGIADGFTPVSFFKGGNPARMGLGNRALSTAKSGYLTRKLIYAMNSVTISKKYVDCKSPELLELYVTKDIAKRLKGRFYKESLHDKELSVVRNPNDLINKTIFLRTPIFCKADDGICETCYGRLLKETGTTKIGILAAQVIGERSTNLLMKSFHTGGTVKISVIDVLDLISRVNHRLQKNILSKLLKQDGVTIEVKQEFSILIDMIEYDRKSYEIGVDDKGDKYIELEFLIGKIVSEKLNINEDIYANVIIKYYPSEINKTEYGYELKFKKGDIWEIDLSLAGEMNSVISVLLSLIEKKNKITSPKYLLSELHRLYESATDADFVHFELIVSQIMRDPDNPAKPARLKTPYKGICVGIKNIPFYESWINGLLFENINKTFEFGLLQKVPSKDTPLTNLFFGEFDE